MITHMFYSKARAKSTELINTLSLSEICSRPFGPQSANFYNIGIITVRAPCLTSCLKASGKARSQHTRTPKLMHISFHEHFSFISPEIDFTVGEPNEATAIDSVACVATVSEVSFRIQDGLAYASRNDTRIIPTTKLTKNTMAISGRTTRSAISLIAAQINSSACRNRIEGWTPSGTVNWIKATFGGLLAEEKTKLRRPNSTEDDFRFKYDA